MPYKQRLSSPLDPADGERDLDTVIVGSGYGGSVLAARLSAVLPKGSVAVLERGREMQPGQYPESFAAALPMTRSRNKPLGMFDLRIGRDMDVLVANALGGGSIINAAVMMLPDANVFESGRWPNAINAKSLAPYYVKSLKSLNARYHPYYSPNLSERGMQTRNVPKFDDLRDASRAWGIERQLSPLRVAINHQKFTDDINPHGVRQPPCNHCGNCSTGCNVGAKNTLLSNYLPMAVEQGANLYSGVEVDSLELSIKPGFNYRLNTRVYSSLDDSGTYRSVSIHCRSLLLAAGALGSSEILLRAQQSGALSLSEKLGSGFSGNGDSFALVAGAPSSGMSGSQADTGPCITGMLDFREAARRGYVIQDGVIPAALRKPVLMYLRARGYRVDESNVQVLLAVGHDESCGKLVLDRSRRVAIVWHDVNNQSTLRSQDSLFQQIARRWGGEALPNPRAAISLLGARGATPITAHPLGGCIMSDSVDTGVTDSMGRVWCRDTGEPYAGLYVVDGSVIPNSLAANPSLTIAALAERSATGICQDITRYRDVARYSSRPKSHFAELA